MPSRAGFAVRVGIGAALLAAAAFLVLGDCGTANPIAPGPQKPAATEGPPRPRPATERAAAPLVPTRDGEPQVPAAGAPSPAAAAAPDDTAAPVRVHGRVVDEDGAGVAGAEVELRTWNDAGHVASFSDIRTKDDGTFEAALAARLAGTSVGMEAAADGFAPAFVASKIAEIDAARGLVVTVERARSVVGRVVDGDGKPIAGAAVHAWFGMETTYWRQVEPDGTFALPPRVPRRAADLVVEAPGHPRKLLALPVGTGERTDVGDIVFRRGGAVTGIVVDPDGLPIPDLRVELGGFPASGGTPATTTDAAGRFAFPDVGEGATSVAVGAEGGAPGARRWYRGLAEGVRAGGPDVRVVASPEFVVVLRLTDAGTGRPLVVSKAEYGMRTAGQPEPESLGASVSAWNDVRSIRFSVLVRGRYDFTVRVPGRAPGRIHGLEVGGSARLEVDLPLAAQQ